MAFPWSHRWWIRFPVSGDSSVLANRYLRQVENDLRRLKARQITRLHGALTFRGKLLRFRLRSSRGIIFDLSGHARDSVNPVNPISRGRIEVTPGKNRVIVSYWLTFWRSLTISLLFLGSIAAVEGQGDWTNLLLPCGVMWLLVYSLIFGLSAFRFQQFLRGSWDRMAHRPLQ